MRERRRRQVNGSHGFDFSLRSEPDAGVLAERRERMRRIFLDKVLTDAGAWRIAREIASTCSSSDGWEAEGLRGLWNPAGGPHGTLRLWAAGYGTHSDGAHMLDLPSGPEGASIREMRAWEVEINRSCDGTMYLCWAQGGEDAADLIMSDPRIGFVDGLLARGGRILRVTEGRVCFAAGPPARDLDPRESQRQAYARSEAELKRGWNTAVSRIAAASSGRTNVPPPPDGVLSNAMDAMRRLRRRSMMAPPDVEVTPNGEIVLEWRGTGHYARLEFRIGPRTVGQAIVSNRARWSIDEERATDRELRELCDLVDTMQVRRGASLAEALRAR